MIKKKLSPFEWILFVSKRFSKIEKESRFSALSILPRIGIAIGVLSLIVILSVMNGFQLESINSILETSSYHIQVLPNEIHENEFLDYFYLNENIKKTTEEFLKMPHLVSVTPFLESQGLLVGKSGKQSPARIRAISQKSYEQDIGFKKNLKIYSGKFDLEQESAIILGSGLAQSLQVRVGDTINILALAGSANVDLFSNERLYKVTALFYTGYSEINTFNAFVSLEEGVKLFGPTADISYGIKLKDANMAKKTLPSFKKKFPEYTLLSWHSFHTSFFDALKLEKNILLFLVLLIFFVVAINIYNGMKKMVYERKEEIAIFHALGASSFSIQSIFILNGLLTGFIGTFIGLVLGLIITSHIDIVFLLIGKIQYAFQYLQAWFFSPHLIPHIKDNSLYTFYASIPAQAYLGEIIFISIFGMLSAVIASWAASKTILQFSITEVLRDE